MKMLSFFLILIISFQVDAQRSCGSVDILEQNIQKDPSVRERMDQIERLKSTERKNNS